MLNDGLERSEKELLDRARQEGFGEEFIEKLREEFRKGFREGSRAFNLKIIHILLKKKFNEITPDMQKRLEIATNEELNNWVLQLINDEEVVF